MRFAVPREYAEFTTSDRSLVDGLLIGETIPDALFARLPQLDARKDWIVTAIDPVVGDCGNVVEVSVTLLPVVRRDPILEINGKRIEIVPGSLKMKLAYVADE